MGDTGRGLNASCILLVSAQVNALQTKAASTTQERPSPTVKGTPIKTGTAMRCSNYMTKLYTRRLLAAFHATVSLRVLLMTYQHEFCFFACSGGKSQQQLGTFKCRRRTHDKTSWTENSVHHSSELSHQSSRLAAAHSRSSCGARSWSRPAPSGSSGCCRLGAGPGILSAFRPVKTPCSMLALTWYLSMYSFNCGITILGCPVTHEVRGLASRNSSTILESS